MTFHLNLLTRRSIYVLNVLKSTLTKEISILMFSTTKNGANKKWSHTHVKLVERKFLVGKIIHSMQKNFITKLFHEKNQWSVVRVRRNFWRQLFTFNITKMFMDLCQPNMKAKDYEACYKSCKFSHR